jgi:hypothetical protein
MRTLKPVPARIYGFIGAVCIERCFRNCFNMHRMLCLLCVWNGHNILKECISQCVWDEDKDNLSRISVGINEKNNPLNIDSGLLDVVNRHYNQIVSSQYPSLVGYLLELLRNGDIYKAYNFLISIRGIGDKIACLFLRDLSIIYGLDTFNDCRNLMYIPIDNIVKSVIDALDKKCRLNYGFEEAIKKLDDNPKSTYIYKIFICENSKRCGLDPRYVEMGMWFFGSKVMKYYNKKLCDYTIKDACKDLIDRLTSEKPKNKDINYIVKIEYIKNSDKFRIHIYGKDNITHDVDENELVDIFLKGEVKINNENLKVEIKDQLLDIIFF